MNRLKIMNSKKKFTLFFMFFFLIQPILNLDYLFYDIYKGFGILAPSTLVNFIGVAFFFIFSWWLFEEDKKKVFIAWGLVGVVVVIYFLLHFFITRGIEVYFPASYSWSAVIEIKYILTLILPFLLIYVVYKVKFSQSEFNTIILFASAFISIMLVLTNVLVISYGSYGNITYDNIFSWFQGAYELYEPRELTSIGFYEAANPISALLILLFPLAMNAMWQEKKWWIGIVFTLQFIAMLVIGTRVAAYGTFILPGIVLIIFVFSWIINRVKWDWSFVIKLIMAICIALAIYPYTPAKRNNEFDYRDQPWVQENEREKEAALKELEGLEGDSYKYALIFLFETQFVYYLTFPREYYEYYYSYKLDPDFWLMIFETPFEQRMNGRQIQKIFSEYKFSDLNILQKIFGGLSFSRLSNGGIVLEQDFTRQYYALGFAGMVLFTFPYLGLIILAVYLGLKHFKQRYTFELALVGISICGVIGVAYYSGHVFDEMMPSYFLALSIGYLFTLLRSNKEAQHG